MYIYYINILFLSSWLFREWSLPFQCQDKWCYVVINECMHRPKIENKQHCNHKREKNRVKGYNQHPPTNLKKI